MTVKTVKFFFVDCIDAFIEAFISMFVPTVLHLHDAHLRYINAPGHVRKGVVI